MGVLFPPALEKMVAEMVMLPEIEAEPVMN